MICCSISYPKSPSHNHPIAAFAKTQDYSSHIRQQLKKYADKISQKTKILHKTKIFAGNAPVLETALAAKAGLGWYGKNSILLHHNFGSYFSLGEIFIDLPLPIDQPIPNRCGNCFRCKDYCPTKTIIAPYKIDTKHCIAYLTIEYKGSIPLELRKIFGCDICQQTCLWNNQLLKPHNTLFTPSNNWEQENLITWFLWSEQEFQEKTQACRYAHYRF
ncbi:MAG: tRNA epoxyqueuosine(34) reductase QueG [Coxiellaceae bacterium]|nr:tRNA epoxyqueuosine(34) reductase QueG [Coxiellaceae bacterium]